jgi:hypothetical protein
MWRAVLIFAAILDLGLAVLLIALSGFVLGPGPESMHADPAATALWAGMLAGSIAAPLVGFVLFARRPCCACMLAWLPPVVTLLAVVLAPPY